MSQNGKRRKWGAADKLRIVLTGLQSGVEVSELCRREGLNPVQYYAWKKQLLGSASRVFDDRKGKPSAQEQRREAELSRLKNVIAEITAENLELKKGLSGERTTANSRASFRSGCMKRSSRPGGGVVGP
jgi:transposase-like protein